MAQRKVTQFERVFNILLKRGSITNFYCIENRITTRLGAIIHKLRKMGWVINGEFIKSKDGSTRNYKYTFVSF